MASGEVEALSRYGRYHLGYRQSEGGGHVDASVAGGLAAVDGRLFATRVVDGSFVMVRVPDTKGVRVYLDNKEVGRTDRKGELLIPRALAHYGNRVAIEPLDLPPDRPPARTWLLLAPPERGGAVAEFLAPLLRVVRGRVSVDRAGQQVNPAYGEIVLASPLSPVDPEGEPWRSELGADGAFEFAALPAGTYVASLRWDGGTCQLALEVPDASGPITRLGVQTCVEVAPPPTPAPTPRPPATAAPAPTPPDAGGGGDTDGDGVADGADQCVDDAETVNQVGDDDGCPDSIVQVVFDGARVRHASYAQLDKLAVSLKSRGQKIRIEGHTADTDQAGNQKRADSVMKYLAKKGVPVDRMKAVGFAPGGPDGIVVVSEVAR